ncbi:MAG: sulfotransferase [Pseudomonadota bacterium]
MTDAPRIVFLTYLSRSGSTLLGRLLQERLSVCVTPEGSFPSELLGLDGFAAPVFDGPDAAARYARGLRASSKLWNWRLDLEEIARGLPTWPATGPDLLRAILIAFRDRWSPGDAVIVYKGDPVVSWTVPEALAAIPEARALHMLRDPRAVLASQRRSEFSYAGGRFSYSVAHTADDWAKSEAQAARGGPREAVLRYEALVEDADAALDGLAPFLGAERRPAPRAGGFAELIPEAERGLHRNLAKPPNRDSLETWRQALPPRDVGLLQAMTAEGLARQGYAPAEAPSPWPGAAAASRLRGRGLIKLAVLRRALMQLKADPGYFLGKLRRRLAGR